MGQRISEDILDLMMTEADRDRDGKLNYDGGSTVQYLGNAMHKTCICVLLSV